MRNPSSIFLLVVVVAISFVVACGGDNSTAPQNSTPPTFSKMMDHSGAGTFLTAVVETSDGVSVVAGEAGVLEISGSGALDGTGTSGVFFAGFKPDGSVAFRTFAAGNLPPGISTMARDASNNLLVTGFIATALTFGTTSLAHNTVQDVFISKLDPTGHPIWALASGGTGDDEGFDIAAAPDGSIYACGQVTGKVLVAGQDTGVVGKTSGYLVKIRPDGSGLWRQTAAPDVLATCQSVAVSQDGSVVVGGNYNGASVSVGGVILPNDGALNGFIARFDANGVPLGNIRIGGTGVAAIATVTTINDDVVVAGAFVGTADFDVNTPAGVVAAVANDAFVARYSKAGQFQWVKTFGSSGDQSVSEMTRTSSGDILVCGQFGGTFSVGSTVIPAAEQDMFIVRLSGGGQVRSVKHVTGAQEEAPSGIASFNDALIVVGTTISTELTLPDGSKRTKVGSQAGFIYQEP